MPSFVMQDPADWDAWVRDQGLPAYRARQLAVWSVRGPNQAQDLTDLPRPVRAQLARSFSFARLSLADKQVSALDGTVKYVFSLPDGNTIESVLMTYRHGRSVCLSTQAGCRMGCTFCASAQAGFGRNLTVDELLAQVTLMEADSPDARISHVTLMGIGEPLDNLAAVVAFLKRVNHPDGKHISMRNLTVSTCGLVPEMIKFTQEGLPVTLSVSLHAPNDAIRRQLMPVARRFPLTDLLAACRQHTDKTGRRITFEYALFDGVNDQPEHAQALADRLSGMLCHVNLIPANEFEGGCYRTSHPSAVRRFQDILARRGLPVTVRRELGTDILAACGQLRRKKEACKGLS